MIWGSVLDKIFGVVDKVVPDAEKKQELKLELVKSMESDKEFRDFILEYEGRLTDLPTFVKYIRTLIRPAFTLWVLGLFNVFLFAPQQGREFALAIKEIPSDLYTVFWVIIFFWFGGRSVNQVVERLKR